MKSLAALVSSLAGELWVMEPERLQAFLARLGNSSLQLAETSGAEAASGPGDGVRPQASRMKISRDGVATIPITGVLMKQVPRIFRAFGVDASGYQEIADDLLNANADPNVTSILLSIDSPGGQVAGVKELADLIASSPKVVDAQIEDLGASGAYWLAAQARSIKASPNALVGSIGVYSTFVDSSKMAEDIGLKVHVVSSGPHKGMGVPGTKITAEQLAAAQEVVDGMALNFTADVAKGRKRPMKDVQEWATGRVWLAKDAQALGIIDGISTHSLNHDKPAAGDGARPASAGIDRASIDKGDSPMNDAEKKAAEEGARSQERERVASIKKAFAEKDASFAMTAIEKGWTLQEAKAEWADVVEVRAAKDREALAEANKKLEISGKTGSRGAAAVSAGGDPEASAGRDFMAVSKQDQHEHQKVCIARLNHKGEGQPSCCTMTSAMTRVQAAQPKLHGEYVSSKVEPIRERKAALGWK